MCVWRGETRAEEEGGGSSGQPRCVESRPARRRTAQKKHTPVAMRGHTDVMAVAAAAVLQLFAQGALMLAVAGVPFAGSDGATHTYLVYVMHITTCALGVIAVPVVLVAIGCESSYVAAFSVFFSGIAALGRLVMVVVSALVWASCEKSVFCDAGLAYDGSRPQDYAFTGPRTAFVVYFILLFVLGVAELLLAWFAFPLARMLAGRERSRNARSLLFGDSESPAPREADERGGDADSTHTDACVGASCDRPKRVRLGASVYAGRMQPVHR